MLKRVTTLIFIVYFLEGCSTSSELGESTTISPVFHEKNLDVDNSGYRKHYLIETERFIKKLNRSKEACISHIFRAVDSDAPTKWQAIVNSLSNIANRSRYSYQLYLWYPLEQGDYKTKQQLYNLNYIYKPMHLYFNEILHLRTSNEYRMVSGKQYVCNGLPILEMQSDGSVRNISRIEKSYSSRNEVRDLASRTYILKIRKK